MILHTDVPTRARLDRLLAAREPWSVSIYLPTSPSSRGDASASSSRISPATPPASDAANDGVVDEIARRVRLNGGKVLAVRRGDDPGRESGAATLRYAL